MACRSRCMAWKKARRARKLKRVKATRNPGSKYSSPTANFSSRTSCSAPEFCNSSRLLESFSLRSLASRLEAHSGKAPGAFPIAGSSTRATSSSAVSATPDRKSTRLNSQSRGLISYAVFCLKKKKKNKPQKHAYLLPHDERRALQQD